MEQPNFEHMYETVDTIHLLMAEVRKLEVEIGELEAKTVINATTSKDLSPDGKVLSATFVINTYKYTGINDEILPKRYKLAEKESDLTRAKNLFEVMKLHFEMWRTEQANQRSGVFS